VNKSTCQITTENSCVNSSWARFVQLDRSHEVIFYSRRWLMWISEICQQSKFLSSFEQRSWVLCETAVVTGVLWKVALVYPNSEPLSFICAFYGCLTAGVIPVPLDVPLSRRVSSTVWVRMHAACHFHCLFSVVHYKCLPSSMSKNWNAYELLGFDSAWVWGKLLLELASK